MGGLHISCGSFTGRDKSGSAIEGVLGALENPPAGLVREITSGFDSNDYILITPEQAAALLPFLVTYRTHLVAEIGHEDPFKAIAAEVAAGADPTKAKWGGGRGWRLYCVDDLIVACEASGAEHQPIVVAYI